MSRTSYEPYGRTASGVTPTIGFTGHVNDADTGLVYMQQRYYDPVAGRFLSVDPVTTDANSGSSFNRFAYANNSPYKYLDRDGRGAITIEGCIVACTSITVGLSNGELAATLTVGVGLGGGFSYDPRSSENGRITNGIGGAGDDLGGMTLAGYTKAGVEVSTPLGGGALGGKLSGGRDLATGKNIGGPSLEAGLSKPDKISAKATISSGAEVSAYIKPANVVASVTASLTATIVGAIKNLFTPPEEKP